MLNISSQLSLIFSFSDRGIFTQNISGVFYIVDYFSGLSTKQTTVNPIKLTTLIDVPLSLSTNEGISRKIIKISERKIFSVDEHYQIFVLM